MASLNETELLALAASVSRHGVLGLFFSSPAEESYLAWGLGFIGFRVEGLGFRI